MADYVPARDAVFAARFNPVPVWSPKGAGAPRRGSAFRRLDRLLLYGVCWSLLLLLWRLYV